MFDYLKTFIGAHDSPNDFYPVSKREIEIAEERLGFLFPSDLKTFFEEIGCGFLKIGVDDSKRDPSLVNRFLSPKEIADILLDEDNMMRPYEGFLKGVMPFFDVGENTYLVLRPKSRTPNKVFWPDGKETIAETFHEFVERLHKNADFYRNSSSS